MGELNSSLIGQTMENIMIRLRNLGGELIEYFNKVDKRLDAIEVKVFGKEQGDIIEDEKPSKKSGKGKKLIALVTALLMISSMGYAGIVNRGVEDDAAIDLSKIDITADPISDYSTNYTYGNKYLHLPEVATASLPAGATANEGGIVYDSTLNKIKYSDGSSWYDIATSGGAVTATAGLTVTGGTVSLNVDSNYAVNVGTGTNTQAVTIGGGSNTVAINSSAWDISTTGSATDIILGSYKENVEVFTSSHVLTAADTGRVCITTGAGITLSLPAAANGLVFTICEISANALNIDPNGTEQIHYSTVSGGDRIQSPGTTGDAVELVGSTTYGWVVRSMHGTWTDNN